MVQKFYVEATQHSDSVLRAAIADLQDGGSTSAKVRGGALQSSYIASFTIPAKPQFGGGELKEAELDLYVTDVDYLAGSSRTPEFSIYKFKEESVINEGPNGFFTEAMYGYGKATGSNNQYSDVVRGGEKLDGRNNIIVYSSSLNGMATLDESFNGKGNSFSDGGEYIAAGRTLFQDSLSYTTPKKVDDYAVRAWGESWLGSWAIARDENYTISEIKDKYAYPAEELGLGASSASNLTGMVIPIEDKALHENSGHTKAITPKDGKEGDTLYFGDGDWAKCIFSGDRNVIDAQAYGDEVTPSNSMFEIVTTAHSFFEQTEAAGEGSVMKATGDIKFSTKTYLSGGQSAELFTYWDQELSTVSGTDTEDETIEYNKGHSTFGGTGQNRQEVMMAKKWIPYPMKHPCKPYRITQDNHEFSNIIEIDINIESLEYAFACGDGSATPTGSGDARWVNLRRAIVVCFGEVEPKTGMTIYDYVSAHASTGGTQTTYTANMGTSKSGSYSRGTDPVACNNQAATGAKNFAAFAIINTNDGIKVIPSCVHPSIGEYMLGDFKTETMSGHDRSNFVWCLTPNSKDVWIADDNHMNKATIEDLTGNWIKLRVCISEGGGPSIWMGDENSYLSWGSDTPGTYDGKYHFIGGRPTFGSLLISMGDKDELVAMSAGSPPLTAVNGGNFGFDINDEIPMNDIPLCNWKFAADSSDNALTYGQFITPDNSMKHMAIFVSNFKESIAGAGNTATDAYMKKARPTSTKVFVDSVKFKNFNYAINNASRGREWNKHPDSINLDGTSAIIGPHGRPSALIYKNPEVETFAATTVDNQYFDYNNMGKLSSFRDVAPTMLSFGFESVTGRYHWRFEHGTDAAPASDIDDMPWLRPYTPMMYFSGFESPNLGNLEEIPTSNMLFTYTSAGDKANDGDIILGKAYSSKDSLMGLGLAYDANAGNVGRYTMNISSLPINDEGWHPFDRGTGSYGYPNMRYSSVPTIALKDFYTGFHLNADVNANKSFVLKSHVHGDAEEDSHEYWQQCLPIRAGDAIKIGDIYASSQNSLTVDTIAHTGTAYIQNDDAAHGLTMVTTTNATGSLAYDAIYVQPEGSIRNWSSKGFAQMSVIAGGDTSTDWGDQWALRENGSASARITDIVSGEGKIVLQVDTLKPLLLNPTDRFIVYIYRDKADPADFGYLGDSIMPTGDPAAGFGCRNFRFMDKEDEYTPIGGSTYNSSVKTNLKIESIDTSTNQITLIWDGMANDGTTKILKYPNIPKLMISAYKQWIHGNIGVEDLAVVHSQVYTGIIFNSGSAGADFILRVGNDSISSITLATPGSGYTSVPTVEISAPSGFGYSQQALATAVLGGTAGEEVVSITIGQAMPNKVGYGYLAKPTVTITGGGGSGATVAAANITMTTPDGISFTNAKWNSRFQGLLSQGIKKGDRIRVHKGSGQYAIENSGVYSVEKVTPTRLYLGKYHSGWVRRTGPSGLAVTITKYEPRKALASRSYRSVVDLQSPFVIKKEQLLTPTEDTPVVIIPAFTSGTMSADTGTLTLTRSVISGASPTWSSLVGQHLMIDDEIVYVKSLGSPDTSTLNIYRGQMRTNTYENGISNEGEGTTHKQGAKVYLVDLHLGGSGEELATLDSSTAANSSDHTQRIINARNLGATYASSQLNFAPDGGGVYGAYLNRWKPYTLPDDEGDLVLKTDFGFGAFDQEKDDGGQVAKGVIRGTGYSEFKMEKLIEAGGVEALDTINFLVTYSDTGTPHEVTFNTRDAQDYNPLLFAIYEDALPIAPTLKVVPYEEDAQLPFFTWEASDSDLWYGILQVDNTNIYNQYHNRELYIPLNDGGIHKRVPSIVKVNDSVTDVTIGSSVRVDRGGLAEYALRFDGEDNFIFGGIVDPDGTTTLEATGGQARFDAELDIGDRIIIGAGVSSYEERVVASIVDYNTLTVDTAFSNTDNDTAPLRLHGNFITYGSGSVDPTPNCTDEMSLVVHIIPDSDISGVSSIVSQRRKYEIELDANKKVVARLFYGTLTSVVLTSSTIVTADGLTPTSIIVTFDKNLKSGNAKLFINGKLEDQSGLITALGSSNNWKNNTDLSTNTNKLYIGAPESSLSTTAIKSNMDAFTFKGLIEELVIYKSCIYPVVPQDQKLIFTKYLSEIEDGSSVSYQARLFIKDYHNIRGSSPNDVAVSAPVSWRKAAFRLED